MWIIYTFEVEKVEDSPVQVSISANRRILCGSKMSIEGFYGSEIAKCSVGHWASSKFGADPIWDFLIFKQLLFSLPEFQLEFFGFAAWTVIQRVTLPLCIFFRFHSTVILTDIWKNSYKTKLCDWDKDSRGGGGELDSQGRPKRHVFDLEAMKREREFFV